MSAVAERERLTTRQARFIDCYLTCLNATRAAIDAGYSEKTAKQIGSENLSKPAIAMIIKERLAFKAGKLEITTAAVLSELKNIGFAPDIKIKASDKVKALELLGKHTGAWVEGEAPGSTNNPIQHHMTVEFVDAPLRRPAIDVTPIPQPVKR